MKKTREDREQLVSILKENKNVATFAFIWTSIVALASIFLTTVVTINLLIAISHRYYLVVFTLILCINVLVLANVLFYYGYIKTNIKNISTININLITKEDVINTSFYITVAAILLAVALRWFI